MSKNKKIRTEVTSGSGIQQEVSTTHNYRRMPDKKPGKHRWIGLVTHVVSEDLARRVYDEQETAFFDIETLADFNVGCVDCERQYLEVRDDVCHAPAFPWNELMER